MSDQTTSALELPAEDPLLELPPYVIVDPGHELAGMASVSVSDLRNHPMVLLDLPRSDDLVGCQFC